jgi:hypothetical protein
MCDAHRGSRYWLREMATSWRTLIFDGVADATMRLAQRAPRRLGSLVFTMWTGLFQSAPRTRSGVNQLRRFGRKAERCRRSIRNQAPDRHPVPLPCRGCRGCRGSPALIPCDKSDFRTVFYAAVLGMQGILDDPSNGIVITHTRTLVCACDVYPGPNAVTSPASPANLKMLALTASCWHGMPPRSPAAIPFT